MFAATKSAGSKPLPEFVSVATSSSGTATISATAPSSIVAGNLLVFVMYTTATGTITSAPSGWTAAYNTSSGTIGSFVVYSKVATSSEPASYSFTHSSSNTKVAAIIQYKQANAVNVAGPPTYTANNTTQPAASISPTKRGLLIATFAYENNRAIATAPSGMTNRVAISTNPAFYVYDQSNVASGATGDKTAIFSGPGSSDGGGILAQIVNQ